MSKEQQAQAQPQVAIPLPKAKKNLVQIGCICMTGICNVNSTYP